MGPKHNIKNTTKPRPTKGGLNVQRTAPRQFVRIPRALWRTIHQTFKFGYFPAIGGGSLRGVIGGSFFIMSFLYLDFEKITKCIKYKSKVNNVRSIYFIFKLINCMQKGTVGLIKYCFIDSVVEHVSSTRGDILGPVNQISPEIESHLFRYSPRLFIRLTIINCGDRNGTVYNIKLNDLHNNMGVYIKKFYLETKWIDFVIDSQFILNPTYRSLH